MASEHPPADRTNGSEKPVICRDLAVSKPVSPRPIDRFKSPTLADEERDELSARDPVDMLVRARFLLTQQKEGVRRYGHLVSTMAYMFALAAAQDATIIDRLVDQSVFRQKKYKPDKTKVLRLAVCYALNGIVEGDPNYSTALRTVAALEAAFERRDTPESVFAQLVEHGVIKMAAEGRKRRSEAKGGNLPKEKGQPYDADSDGDSVVVGEGEGEVHTPNPHAANSAGSAPRQSLDGFVELRVWVPEGSLATALSGPDLEEKQLTYWREGQSKQEWLLKGRL